MTSGIKMDNNLTFDRGLGLSGWIVGACLTIFIVVRNACYLLADHVHLMIIFLVFFLSSGLMMHF